MEAAVSTQFSKRPEDTRYVDLCFVGLVAVIGLFFFVKGVGMMGYEQYTVGQCKVESIRMERLVVKWDVEFQLRTVVNYTQIHEIVDDIDEARSLMDVYEKGSSHTCYELKGKFKWMISNVYFYTGLFMVSMGLLFSVLSVCFFYSTKPEAAVETFDFAPTTVGVSDKNV